MQRGASEVDAALAWVLGSGVRPLRLQETVFDAMLEGWCAQQTSRHLEANTIKQRASLVRRAVRHLGEWPWEWTALTVEEFIVDLANCRLARSTIRSFQGSLKVFLEYVSMGGIRGRRSASASSAAARSSCLII